MRKLLVFVVLATITASCDQGDATSTTSVAVPTTTIATTADPAVCETVASDAVDLVADIVEVLDEVDIDELTETGAWGDELTRLRERGVALDAEAAAAGCAPGVIQAAVRASFEDLDPGSALSELLLTLMAPTG
jgi:hypothetical protein